MRFFYSIFIIAAVISVICGGCFKGNDYGKFSKEEVERMPYAARENLPEPSGGITLSVMGETITADEILAQQVIDALRPYGDMGVYGLFERDARPVINQVVISKVSDVLIYHLAKKNAPSNIDEMLEKSVEKEVNKYITNYGNNYALAERAFKEMGFADWKSFREYKKKFIMTQIYLSKQHKENKPITHGDMINRYKMYIAKRDPDFIWDTKVKMRVIDIQPDKLNANEIAGGESEEYAAVRKGRELLTRIEKGEDFGKLAEAHSDGIGKGSGGLWAENTVGSLLEPYDILEKAAVKMKAGDVSGLLEADGHVFILKLEDKREGGVVPFVEVQGRIEEEIRLIHQRNKYNKVFAEIVDQANVEDLGRFTEYCLKRAFDIVTTTN